MSQKHGFVIDKLVRTRIFNSRYWKEECFGLNAQTLIDKAILLKYIGSTYSGSRKPTKFICLLYKMLQMNLPKEVAIEFLKTRDYKYLTVLAIFYLRLVEKAPEVYYLLEPFFNDNRKIRMRNSTGVFSLMHVDELVDQLLNQEIVLEIVLPRIPKRQVLEDQGVMEPYVSVLEEELFENEGGKEGAAANNGEEGEQSHNHQDNEDQ